MSKCYGCHVHMQDVCIDFDIDRKTALSVLKDLSKRMYPSRDLFGGYTLVIDRSDFETVRKKYLDRHKEKNNET